MSFNTKFKMLELNVLLSVRGLEAKGRVQQYIDSEVLRLTDPYVPKDSGELKRSGTRHTKIGSGEVRYKTPYARRQYFENKGRGLRGKQWFERAKIDHKDSILRGAAKIAGARGEK